MSISTRGLHVPSSVGTNVWFNGDVLTVKLTSADTDGHLGVVKASVPPGGGPAPHKHTSTDETFYVMDGELEFLDGDRVFTAGPGDAVFIPRGTTHRFHNPGLAHASMLFFYTPGGAEQLSSRAGTPPCPGSRSSPGP